MIHYIKMLLHDIDSRRFRGPAVVGLTIIAVLALQSANSGGTYFQLAYAISFACLAAIIYLATTDKAQGMHVSRSAVYSTLVSVTIWVMSIYYVVVDPLPLWTQAINRASDGSLINATLTVSPFVMATALVIFVITWEGVAHYITRNRKKTAAHTQ